MSEPSKRYITDYFANSKGPGLTRKSKGFPDLPDDLRAQLETVPRLARKNVSDGYKFATKIPSYQGLAIGPTKPSTAVSFEFGDQINGKRSLTVDESASIPVLAGRSRSDYPTPSAHSFVVEPNRSSNKRGFTDGDETDEEDDGQNEYRNVRVISSNRHNLATKSQSMPLGKTDDFEDAEFLMSREVVFNNE